MFFIGVKLLYLAKILVLISSNKVGHTEIIDDSWNHFKFLKPYPKFDVRSYFFGLKTQVLLNNVKKN